MRAIALCFSAAGTISWTPDRDCELSSASSSAGQFFISENPSLTLADFTAPSSNNVRNDLLFVGWSATTAAAHKPAVDLKIPLSKDRTYYVQITAVGTVMLYLTDITTV